MSDLINGKPHITTDVTSWVDILWKGCVSADHFVIVFYMKCNCELYKTTACQCVCHVSDDRYRWVLRLAAI